MFVALRMLFDAVKSLVCVVFGLFLIFCPLCWPLLLVMWIWGRVSEELVHVARLKESRLRGCWADQDVDWGSWYDKLDEYYEQQERLQARA